MKPSTRGRGLSSDGVSSGGTLSCREAGQSPKRAQGGYSGVGVGGSRKPVPASVEKEGGNETQQASHLKSSSCTDLHPGSQRRRPLKGSRFPPTSDLSKSSVADRQKRDSSARGAAPTSQGEGRRKTGEEGSSCGVPPNSGQHATERVDGGGLSKSATVSRLEREVTVSEQVISLDLKLGEGCIEAVSSQVRLSLNIRERVYGKVKLVISSLSAMVYDRECIFFSLI